MCVSKTIRIIKKTDGKNALIELSAFARYLSAVDLQYVRRTQSGIYAKKGLLFWVKKDVVIFKKLLMRSATYFISRYALKVVLKAEKCAEFFSFSVFAIKQACFENTKRKNM